jgi:hypothetical protein
MTRKGSSKKVDSDYAGRRLANARAFHRAARNEFASAESGANMNPAMSLIVSAVIAYTDALTARRKSLVNQQDHSTAAKLLRDAFGRELPAAQERQLRRILGEKDEVQYGVNVGQRAEAADMLEDLDAFAAWAELQLADK